MFIAGYVFRVHSKKIIPDAAKTKEKKLMKMAFKFDFNKFFYHKKKSKHKNKT